MRELSDGERGERDPGGDGCAAPGGVDEADGDVLAGVDLAAEEEGDGGEAGGGGGIAGGPGGGLVVEGIVVGFFVEDEEMDLAADVRIGGGGDLLVGVLDDGRAREAAKGHLHVGLAGGEPDVADEDVGEGNRCSPVDGEGVGAAGWFRCEVKGPRAEVVGFGRGVLMAEVDGDSSAGCVPAPDVNGTITLEDGVVAEHVREAGLARGLGRSLSVRAERAEEQREREAGEGKAFSAWGLSHGGLECQTARRA